MASIQKTGDKWRAQVARKGVRKSAVWDTKREAVAWATRVEAEIDAGKQRGHTFQDAIDRYLKTVSVHKESPDWERRRLDSMALFFDAATPIVEIDSDRIGEWRDFRLLGDDDNPPVQASTVLREVNLLRNLFTLATDEWRWIERNPFKGVRLPKDVPPREKVWGWREIRRVLRHAQGGGEKTRQVGWAFHVALRTSLRLSEVLIGRFDAKSRVVLLSKTKTTQAGQLVKVPVTRAGARILAKCPPFTVGANEASVLFCELARAALVRDLTFRDSRATALTLMSRKMDVLTLSKISRHRDMNILMNTYYRETAEQVSARI
jgi:integrase